MPQVNHVKSARALYETKPDIDPTTGEQKTALVFQKDGVTPKTDKRGNQIIRRLTVRDLDRPKPNLRCDFPGCEDPEIRPGQSYKFLALRFGQKNRHEDHPNWQHWEYSSSVAAQAARLVHDLHNEIDSYEFSTAEDFDDLKGSLEQQVQDFVDERTEALENMPEQLQDGSPAQENAENAEAWLDEFESINTPDDEYEDCETCEGTGQTDDEAQYTVKYEDGDEEGPFETEGEAEDALEADDRDGDIETTYEEEDTCPDCDGGKTDTLSEEWVEAAKDVLREAVDAGQF